MVDLIPHSGSWLGGWTPDFGISEALASYYGQGATAQGGSNLFGDQSQTTLVPSGTTSSGSPTYVPSGTSGAYGVAQGSAAAPAGGIAPPGPLGGGTTGGATDTSTPGFTGTPQQAPSGPSIQDQQRDSLFALLDQQIGGIDEMGRLGSAEVANQYGLGKSGIESSAAGQRQALGGYRTEAVSNKAKTLKDVAGDFRNALQAGQTYLGGIGAGSSSAVGRLSGALSKAANQRTTDVGNSFNQIWNNIDMKAADVERTVSDQMAQLDSWKGTELNKVLSWVNQAKQNLQGLKFDVQKQMSDQIMQEALNQLRNVQQQQATYQNAIAQWGTERAGSLAQMKEAIAASGQYQVPNIGYTAFNTGIFSPQGGAGQQYYGGQGGTETKKPLIG